MVRLPAKHQKPRNYLSRREQWRLLLLFGSLGLVLILMNEARKPENWQFFQYLTQQSAESEAAASASQPPVDSRLPRDKPPEEIPGTFHSPAEPDESAETEVVAEGYFPGVNPKYFSDVRDGSPFRYEERHSWFNLLGLLQRTDAKTLAENSLGKVTYAQLFEQSDFYRGKLVTLKGTIRRAMRARVQENDLGLDFFYQLVLRPEGSSDPVILYCLELPKDFPQGMDISEDAEMTGFYFKRWVYLAGDDLRTAPTVLVKTFTWLRQPVVENNVATDPLSVAIVVGVGLGLGALVVLFIYFRSWRSSDLDEELPDIIRAPLGQVDAAQRTASGPGAANDQKPPDQTAREP